MASVAKREWTSPKGEKKSGWEVRYKEGGKHRSRTFKMKKQADAYRQKVERETADGTHVAESEKRTVDEVCEAFMRLQEDRVRNGIIGQGRYENLKKAVDRNIKPLLGRKLIADVTPSEIETWFHEVVRKHGLAPQTARTRLIDLKCVFEYAQRYGYAKANPAQGAIKQIGSLPRVKIKTFEETEVRGLFLAVQDRPFRFRERSFHLTRAFVYLASLCGLRLGEIRALRGRHVDFARNVIEVRHSLTDSGTMKPPKTKAGIRDVPMPPPVVEALREIMAAWYVPNEMGFILTSSTGAPMSPGNFRNEIWYPLLDRASLKAPGGKQMHFHALRHFYCSMMMHNGVGPSDVAALVGHSHFDLTLQVYAHPVLTGRARAEPSDRLAASLMPPRGEVTTLEPLR